MSRRRRGLFKATQRFLGATDGKVPYIIGVAGSVAVGKSTTARVLQALLTRWPNTPKVQLVTTDGFLHPNAELIRQGIMDRKGFPESYDGTALIRFLSAIKAGMHNVAAPVYSHLTYDIVPGETITRRSARHPHRRGRQRAAAEPAAARRQGDSVRLRLLRLLGVPRRRRRAAGAMVHRAFHAACGKRRSAIRAVISANTPISTTPEAEATARSIWRRINLVNLHENILPTRPRADLLLTKGASHRIEEVALRKL